MGVIRKEKNLDISFRQPDLGLVSGRCASQIGVLGLIRIDLPLMFKADSNIM